MFIDPCSNGRSVLDEDGAYGNFIRFGFRYEGTYAHANGNGQPVSMITNPGTSMAVFWAPVLQ